MKYTLLFLAFCTSIICHSQNATNLTIKDSRSINDLPSFNTRSVRADLKDRSTIGVPGSGTHSTSISIAPWIDATGGLAHQLNFNDGGVYYRNGSFNSQSWNGWQRIITEDNSKNIAISQNSLLGRALFDTFIYDNQKMGHYALRWGDDSYTNYGPVFWLSAYGGIKFFTAGKYQMGITDQGNVGIGTDKPKEKLEVNGTIRAKEIKIEAENWADFVFDKNYKLPTLDDVKAHIDEHKHLPNIPSEKEVQENGIGLGEMQVKLLQKIEELTLYVIELKEENKDLINKINKLINE